MFSTDPFFFHEPLHVFHRTRVFRRPCVFHRPLIFHRSRDPKFSIDFGTPALPLFSTDPGTPCSIDPITPASRTRDPGTMFSTKPGQRNKWRAKGKFFLRYSISVAGAWNKLGGTVFTVLFFRISMAFLFCDVLSI